MTREEAIERFENVKASALVQKASGVSEYWQNEIDGTIEAIDMAIEALSEERLYTHEEAWEMTDLISRADAIEAVMNTEPTVFDVQSLEPHQKTKDVIDALMALPSADAVQGYTEWLEKIIVEAETFEWLCENATDKEWCEKNCNYASIQAECLRHLYEVNKGGDDEWQIE